MLGTYMTRDRLLLLLLFVSVWINYMDRGNLSVAAPVLGPELGLDASQMGLLLSSFFWTYSLLQPAAGWVVDRFNVYRVYAVGFAIWSVAVIFGGGAHSLTPLLLSRLMLGAGESVAYPAYSRILTAGFPEHRRGLANALVDVGTKAGPALGIWVGGMLVASVGWRWFFFGMGAISLIWIAPWLAVTRGVASVREESANVSLGRILSKRQPWLTFGGLFGFNYAWYFLLTWLPSYLTRERHFTIREMAVAGAFPFAVTAVSAVLTGWYCDRLIARGASASRVRKGFAITGLLVCAATLPLVASAEIGVALVCLGVAFAGIGLFTANCWAMTQRMAGVAAARRWTGLQNAVGNMGGVAAPLITGATLERTGSFGIAFLTASGMLILAGGFYLVLGKVEAVEWENGD